MSSSQNRETLVENRRQVGGGPLGATHTSYFLQSKTEGDPSLESEGPP